jgi:hypothetical protein
MDTRRGEEAKRRRGEESKSRRRVELSLGIAEPYVHCKSDTIFLRKALRSQYLRLGFAFKTVMMAIIYIVLSYVEEVSCGLPICRNFER